MNLSMKLPVFQNMASAMEIPEDLAKKAALVEMTGQNHMRIENYLGIIEYSDVRLLLQCSQCRIEVTGRELHITYYTREELCLKGRIEQVHYC